MYKNGILQIAVSLSFAALMIGSSCFIEDKSTRHQVVFMLIAAWFTPYSLLVGRSYRCGRCCRGGSDAA